MLFVSCSNDDEAIIDAIDYKTYPSQSAEDIEVVRTDSGQVVLKIFATKYESYSQLEDKPYEEYPKGIKLVTYSEYPTVSSSLVCKYAKHDIDTDKWEARDDVIVVNVDGDSLRTEQMFWDAKAEKIYSDKSVNIRTSTEIIYGTGFTAKQDFTGWKINNVKGTIYLDE